MSEMSDYLETALLNVTLRGTAYTAPANVYVALFTSDPTDAGTGTQVSGGSYARVVATFTAPSGTGGSITNNADITFPTATGSWGLVGWIGIFDALTGGNMLYYTPLDAAKQVDTGDVFRIVTGNLSVTLS